MFDGDGRISGTSRRRQRRAPLTTTSLLTKGPVMANDHPTAPSPRDMPGGKLGTVRVRGRAPVDLDALRVHVLAGNHIDDFARLAGLHANTVRRLCLDHGIPTGVWKSESLSVAEASWVAACIDCEGTITAHAVPDKSRSYRGVQVFSRVQMTCQLVPQRLRQLCGGSFSGPKPRQAGHKPIYLWNIAANGCRYLLPQILPTLLTKRRQAEVALAILGGNRQGHSMPNGELVPLLEEMRRLNARGLPGTADFRELRPATPRRHSDEEIACACGCSGRLRRYDRRGRERLFIHGHNTQQGGGA